MNSKLSAIKDRVRQASSLAKLSQWRTAFSNMRRTVSSADQQQQQHQQEQHHHNNQQRDNQFWLVCASAAVGGVIATAVAGQWINNGKGRNNSSLYADVMESAMPTLMTSNLSRLRIDKSAGVYPKWYEVGVTNSRTRIKPATEPEHFEFILVGAGQAARACLETLNGQISLLGKAFARHKILMVAEERDTRINALVTSKADIAELQRLSTPPNTTVIFGPTVEKLDVHSKLVQLSDGRIFSYSKLFIGTGGVHPEGLPCTNEKARQRLIDLRTLNDLERLDELIDTSTVHNIAVVGGGTFGVETALNIYQRQMRRGRTDVTVTQIYAEPGVLYKILPEYFRAYLTARLRGMGIIQKNFTLVGKVDMMPGGVDQVLLDLDSWERSYVPCDLVVFAPTTVCANTELASEAGLEIDENNGGVMVNRELCATTDVYAGGDAISYPNVVLGRRRDQNYDHAVASGVIAAHNMMGERWPYYHLPVQTVDLQALGLRIEMVGVVDGRCETVAFWDTQPRKSDLSGIEGAGKYDRGIIYYLNNGYIVGVSLVNIEGPNAIEAARQVLYDQIDYTGVENIEAELRDLIPHRPFATTLVRHVNMRSVVRELVHGRQSSAMNAAGFGRNPFKVRRTLMVDKQFLPEDVLRVKGGIKRNVNINSQTDVTVPPSVRAPLIA